MRIYTKLRVSEMSRALHDHQDLVTRLSTNTNMHLTLTSVAKTLSRDYIHLCYNVNRSYTKVKFTPELSSTDVQA